MTDNNHIALKNIIANLGIAEAIEMLEYALPRIVQRKNQLSQHIHAQDWEAAKQYAHQTISSVSLYGSESLETQLHRVKLLGTTDIDPITFEQELSLAFDHVVQGVKEWLNQQANDAIF
jgi:HPt (histidine-containing phosphotransfer) domain-containing protein